MAGPAPSRPNSTGPPVNRCRIKLSTGVSTKAGGAPTVVFPAAAVPVRAKIPAPTVAPTPKAVRSNAERDRFILLSGISESLINRSGFFFLSRMFFMKGPSTGSQVAGRSRERTLPACFVYWLASTLEACAPRMGPATFELSSHFLQLRITLHQFLLSPTGKAYGDLEIIPCLFSIDHHT